MAGMPQRDSIGALLEPKKGVKRTNFLILCCSVFRPFWPLKPFKMALKVVLEVLLDVPEVVLEVLEVVLGVHVLKTPCIENAMY